MTFLAAAAFPSGARKGISGPADILPRSNTLVAGQSNVPRRNTPQLLELYSTSPWVRLASDVVSNRYAQATWYLLAPVRGKSKRRSLDIKRSILAREGKARADLIKEVVADQEYRRLDEHPFLTMWTQGVIGAPWLELPGFEVAKLGQITRDFVGEEVLILTRNAAGIPVRWFPVPPSWIRIPTVQDNNFYLVITGQRLLLPAEDVVYHRTPAAANPYSRGTGIAQALDHEIEIDEQMAAYLASFLKNRARPDLLIMGPGIGERERLQMESAWQAKLGGALKQAVVHFLGIPPSVKASEVLVHDLQKTAADLEASSMRKDERDIIVQVWGVPPDTIGAAQNSNRATAMQAERNLRSNAVVPRTEAKQRFLQTRFFDQRGDRPAEYMGEDRLILQYEMGALVDDEEQRQAMAAAPYAWTEAEWRVMAGMPAREGADQVRFLPLGIQMVGLDGEPVVVDPNAGDTPLQQAVRGAFQLVLAGEGVGAAASQRGLTEAQTRALRLMAVAHGFAA